MVGNAPTAFPYGLHNASEDVRHLMTLCLGSPPTDDEFVGMTDYVLESFHDLLGGESETISNSDSSKGSHNPSQECFMADSPKGRVKSAHDGNTVGVFTVGLPRDTLR
jgi:hypothetical protein